MKKLVLAVAASAAMASGIAMASPAQNNHQAFVSVFGGIDTTSTWSDINKQIKATGLDYSFNNIHPWVLGIATGYNLWQVSPTLNIGAEVGFNFAPSATKFSVGDSKNGVSLSARHTAINPMLFVNYTPIQKLTLTGKAGMGYQNYRYTSTVNLLNHELEKSHNRDAWKPVLAAEAAYNLSNRYALLLGDQYTFGGSMKIEDAAKEIASGSSWSGVPSSNLVYVGAKVNF